MQNKPLQQALNELLQKQESTPTSKALEQLDFIIERVSIGGSYLTESEMTYIKKLRNRISRRKGDRF